MAQKCVLGYKLLMLAVTDKKSTVPLDFSLHAEAGRKKDFGLTRSQRADRFRKRRAAGDCSRFRDIRDGLLELTFIERLLPLIAELLERIARLFDSTLDDLFEKAIADPETRMDLEYILRYNQDFKDRT